MLNKSHRTAMDRTSYTPLVRQTHQILQVISQGPFSKGSLKRVVLGAQRLIIARLANAEDFPSDASGGVSHLAFRRLASCRQGPTYPGMLPLKNGGVRRIGPLIAPSICSSWSWFLPNG